VLLHAPPPEEWQDFPYVQMLHHPDEGRPCECFENSCRVARKLCLRAAVGVASGVPHAWVVDRDGTACEVTGGLFGECYRGFIIDVLDFTRLDEQDRSFHVWTLPLIPCGLHTSAVARFPVKASARLFPRYE
jgi:hypothetical protein